MKQREKPTMLLIGLIALLCLTICPSPEDTPENIPDKQLSQKYPYSNSQEQSPVYPVYPPSVNLRWKAPYSGYTSRSFVIPESTSSRNFLAR